MADAKWRAEMPYTWVLQRGRNPSCFADEVRRLVTRANAELDAAEAREAAKDARIAELEYASGYAADLACIDRVLDEVGAPHDCEDGVSLSPKRIRLMAERIAELERALAISQQERLAQCGRFSLQPTETAPRRFLTVYREQIVIAQWSLTSLDQHEKEFWISDGIQKTKVQESELSGWLPLPEVPRG